ncbi:MAG: tRNA (guanine(10)-N(2))-dimethyltransferase [Candidatus Methanospirareceae archaeon]
MFLEVKEGSTRILIPKRRSRSIFYNPKMELSRDIDVASVAAFVSLSSSPTLSYIDALAATGVRGVRVAKEVGLSVDINDKSRDAYEVIKKNIELNGVGDRARAWNENANILLHHKKYDIIDIDPFGSPIPFLDAACASVRKLIMVTATDTAPLCGAHPGGVRKYEAFPLNTEYHKEIATRILLGALTRYLARYDKSTKPLLCYSKEHFIRLIVGVERGVKKAEESLRRLGFIAHCFSCGNRFAFPLADILEVEKVCGCGSKIRIAGPLYIGGIEDRGFCELVCKELRNREMGTKREALKIVEACAEEINIPFYYELHVICKRLKKTPPTMQSILEALKERGYAASRTHFSDTAFKTDADIREIEEIVNYHSLKRVAL